MVTLRNKRTIDLLDAGSDPVSGESGSESDSDASDAAPAPKRAKLDTPEASSPTVAAKTCNRKMVSGVKCGRPGYRGRTKCVYHLGPSGRANIDRIEREKAEKAALMAAQRWNDPASGVQRCNHVNSGRRCWFDALPNRKECQKCIGQRASWFDPVKKEREEKGACKSCGGSEFAENGACLHCRAKRERHEAKLDEKIKKGGCGQNLKCPNKCSASSYLCTEHLKHRHDIVKAWLATPEGAESVGKALERYKLKRDGAPQMLIQILEAFKTRPELVALLAEFDFPDEDDLAYGDSETGKTGVGSNDAENCIEISITYTKDGKTKWYCPRPYTGPDTNGQVERQDLEDEAIELNEIFATRKLCMYGAMCDYHRFDRILNYLPDGYERSTIEVFEPMNQLRRKIFTHDVDQREATTGKIYVPFWGLSSIVRGLAPKSDVKWARTYREAIEKERARPGKSVMDVCDLINLVRFLKYIAEGNTLETEEGQLEI